MGILNIKNFNLHRNLDIAIELFFKKLFILKYINSAKVKLEIFDRKSLITKE